MKKHNFSAGPSVLPEEVLEKSAKALLDFDDGLSLIEISHRSKAFVDVMENARSLALELLGREMFPDELIKSAIKMKNRLSNVDDK